MRFVLLKRKTRERERNNMRKKDSAKSVFCFTQEKVRKKERKKERKQERKKERMKVRRKKERKKESR